MPQLICLLLLGALVVLSGCDQPTRTSAEVAAEGAETALERLPDADGAMTNSAPSGPVPGTF